MANRYPKHSGARGLREWKMRPEQGAGRSDVVTTKVKQIVKAGLAFGVACAVSVGTVPNVALAEAFEELHAQGEQPSEAVVETQESDEADGTDAIAVTEDSGTGLIDEGLPIEETEPTGVDTDVEEQETSEESVAPAAVDVAGEDAKPSDVEIVDDGVALTAQASSTSISAATIASIAKQAYTGKAVRPTPKVTLNGKELTKGTDFTLTYKNNVKAGTATVTVTGKGEYTGSKNASFKIVAPSVSYSVHVQTYGDQETKKDGAVAGTSGESKRLEAIRINLGASFPVSGGIKYRTHVQTYGWQDWASDGGLSGTEGESKRLEAIQIKLTGTMAKKYDVWYRVHAQNAGWLAWAKNGEKAGSSSLSWRLEAIQIVISPKNGTDPGNIEDIKSANSRPYLSNPGATYRTHVQTYGWQDWVKNGQMSGTVGESKRLEALELKFATDLMAGSIKYRTHVQTYGWQDWVSNGALSGTEGESKRLEAIQVKLTGDAGKYFDVWYRTQVQTYGWLGWAKNGQTSGTANLSRRMETLEIQILPKGSPAPGSTENTFVDKVSFTSGDAQLDEILNTIIETRTGRGSDALQRAFNYVVGFPYIDGEAGIRGDWREWSVAKAKEMYYRPGGNCYHYGSLMAWIARALGYDARAMSGEVQSGVLSWSYHGWCEVTMGGVKYVIDPDLQKYIPNRNFFMVTYDEAPTYYTPYY